MFEDPDERTQLTRRIRKKLHQAAPSCVAVVDHVQFVGAYFYAEDMAEGEKAVKEGDWEGVTVLVREAPPITMGA
jgi:hypothetical protein